MTSLAFTAFSLSAQTGPILRVRVVDSVGSPARATVTVRDANQSAVILAQLATDSAGVAAAPLTRLVHRLAVEAFSADGRRARVEIDSGVVGTSRDRPVVLRLGAASLLVRVEVRARYQRRPSVFNYFDGEPSSRAEPSGLGVTRWLDPINAGSINALLQASPELLIGADQTVSALGTPGSSTQTQIGGVRVLGGLISGGLGGAITVSPWDASIGGAAGATLNLFLQPSSRLSNAYVTGRTGLSARSRDFGDDAGAVRYAGVPAQMNAGLSGPLGSLAYRISAFASSEASSLPDWTRGIPIGTKSLLDSIAALLNIETASPNESASQLGLFGRIDFLPFSPKHILALTSGLTHQLDSRGTRGTFSTSGLSAKSSADVGFLQLESSEVIRERVLLTTLANAAISTATTERRVIAPTASFADSGLGALVRTGGLPQLPRLQTHSAELRSTASWFSRNNRARFTLQVQSRVEQASLGSTSAHSTFLFSSLPQVASGIATSFERTGARGQDDALSVVLAPSLNVRVDRGASGSVSFGLRADGWRTFGIAAPKPLRHVDLSPRFSLLQRIGSRSARRGQVATLRAGAGRFTDWPSVVQWASAWTGSPQSIQQCSGEAAPQLDIRRDGDQCNSPSSARTVSQTIADLALLPVVSDRADVSLAFAEVAPGIRAEFGVALARTSRIQAVRSAYFGMPVVAMLPGEQNRALLVPVTSISPAGYIEPAAFPSSVQGQRVLTSAGSSQSVQSRLRLATSDPFASTRFDVAYIYTAGTERSFAIAPSLGPLSLVTAPFSSAGRHSISFSVGTWLADVELTFSGLIRSGARFTPLADRDLNGDGLANDAAFIPLGRAKAWEDAVEPRLRSCIRESAGRIATVNSCSGPWSISSIVTLSVPGVHFGMPLGSVLDFQISNPLAVFQARDNASIVFGSPIFVDPTAVAITGFDSVSKRFNSAPLGRFGKPAYGASIGNPLRIAVSVRIPLGRSVTSQRADAADLILSKDTSSQALSRAAAAFFGDIPPLPVVVLQAADALELTAIQRAQLQSLWLRWQSSSASLMSAPANGTVAGAMRMSSGSLRRARPAFMAEVGSIASEIRKILTPDQAALLPDSVKRMLNPKFLRFLMTQDAASN